MKRIVSILCAVALAAVLADPATAARDEPTGASARAVVERTADQVLAVLNTPQLSSEERRRRLEEIAYERFDFETVSRLVLARYWNRFTPQQREEFVREFKRHLALNYGSRIDRYNQEKLEILGERSEPRGDVTVRTRIVGGQADNFAVDYRLRQKNGTWYLIDVLVEGVSVVSSYRTQFQEILGQGGPGRLLTTLREKNASGDPGLGELAPPAAPGEGQGASPAP